MKQAILTLLLLGGAAIADAQETPDSLPPTPRSGSEEPAGLDSRGRLRVDRRQEGRSGGGPAGPAVSSSSKCFSAQAHSASRGTRRDSPRRVSEYSTARGAHLIPVLRMPVRNRSRSFSF